MSKLAAAILVVLALAPAARAGSPLYVGAAEDAAKHSDLVVAKAKMDLAALAGFDAIRMTAIWSPGQRALEGYELTALENATAAANLNGIRVVLSIYHKGSATTPLTPAARADFAAFAADAVRVLPTVQDVIVGNEPNLNLFWLPQFTAAGASASPAAYGRLLAQTYDALKAASPQVTVLGGSVSPRGGDNPWSVRHTHSPTRFLRELGRHYRASRRTRPLMDALAFHPYGESSSVPPQFERSPRSTSIGLSEYDRLVAVLAAAFDGTAQRGSTLPIVYDEYGVDTRIPDWKAGAYAGREPPTTRPVDEATQASYYRTALRMAACQPNVRGLLYFHVSDEPDLDRWQSGVFYADDDPKASLPGVRRAVDDLRSGQLARCATWPRAAKWRTATPAAQAALKAAAKAKASAARASGAPKRRR